MLQFKSSIQYYTQAILIPLKMAVQHVFGKLVVISHMVEKGEYEELDVATTLLALLNLWLPGQLLVLGHLENPASTN